MCAQSTPKGSALHHCVPLYSAESVTMWLKSPAPLANGAARPTSEIRTGYPLH